MLGLDELGADTLGADELGPDGPGADTLGAPPPWPPAPPPLPRSRSFANAKLDAVNNATAAMLQTTFVRMYMFSLDYVI
jgi:hypothetical protein